LGGLEIFGVFLLFPDGVLGVDGIVVDFGEFELDGFVPHAVVECV
jgi:hypothetical protein